MSGIKTMSQSDEQDPNLFRSEALVGQRLSIYGTISTQSTSGQYMLGMIAIVLLVLIVSVLVLGKYTRKTTVFGLVGLESGLVRITARQGGQVESITAYEGQKVTQGQDLFTISTGTKSRLGKNVELNMQNIQERRDIIQSQKALVLARLSGNSKTAKKLILISTDEKSKHELEVKAKARLEQLARRRFATQSDLHRNGLLSTAELERYEMDLLTIISDRRGLERAGIILNRQMIKLTSDSRDLEETLQLEIEEKNRMLAALDQERLDLAAESEFVVTAPLSGTVTGINVNIGQQIAPRQPYANITPIDAKFMVNLYANSKQIGFIETGQQVAIRYAAYPYQKFGVGHGVVVSTSETPYSTSELPAEAAIGLDPSELYYTITVMPMSEMMHAYGAEITLRLGMALEADIVHETRHLYEWILAPIYAISRKQV